MTAELLALGGALVAGTLLGAFFFGGLWWTVRRIPGARSPGLLLASSALVRTAVVVAGIWLVMDGRWERAVVSLVGFVAVRVLVVRPVAEGGEPPLSGVLGGWAPDATREESRGTHH